jgi:thioredoxin reductase (NADPH)
VWLADAVILATGATAKWLGLESEERLKGFGVSACATCDGFFYRGQEIVVVGGGNTAVEEALFLTNFATKVTLVHRRDTLRGREVMQERLFKHPKIEVIWNHEVVEVLGGGTEGVSGVTLRDLLTGARRTCPPRACSSPSATRRPRRWWRTSSSCTTAATSRWSPAPRAPRSPRVRGRRPYRHVYRQAVTSAGMGCMARARRGAVAFGPRAPDEQGRDAAVGGWGAPEDEGVAPAPEDSGVRRRRRGRVSAERAPGGAPDPEAPKRA